jgi:hypothetical protein
MVVEWDQATCRSFQPLDERLVMTMYPSRPCPCIYSFYILYPLLYVVCFAQLSDVVGRVIPCNEWKEMEWVFKVDDNVELIGTRQWGY